jgi:hypothetical protein
MLKLALAAAEALRIPEAQTIRRILAQATPGMPAKPGFLRRLRALLGRWKSSP